MTPSVRQLAASGLSAAAALTFSPPSRQRIAAQPSGEITEYIAFSCMSTRSASAIAIAPPEPPSPMMQATIGTVSRLIRAWLRAIAPPWPCCSAAKPGEAPGVRTREPIGKCFPWARTIGRLASRLGHSVVAADPLVRVAALLVAEERDGLARKPAEAGNHRRVLRPRPVPVELDEVPEEA